MKRNPRLSILPLVLVAAACTDQISPTAPPGAAPAGADPTPPSLQRFHAAGHLVSPSVRQQIRVDLSAIEAEDASWAAAAREAMAGWNSIQGSVVTFVEGLPAHISVYPEDWYHLGSCVPADALYPTANGMPGHRVRISRAYLPAYSYAQRVLIVAHELGHTIGFEHTNGTGGAHIPGTPGAETYSVMNAPTSCDASATPAWAGLSSGDQAALLWAYPNRAQPVVSNASGHPHLSWPALAGAWSYTVVHVVERTVEDAERGNSLTRDETVIATLTGTSLTDFGRQHTGYSECVNWGWPVSVYESHWYEVRAHFPVGSTTGWTLAPTAHPWYC